MSTSPTVGAWQGEQFAHEAFVYDTDDEVRRRCVPYVEEGLDLGQQVVLVASRPVREMLLAVLGDRLDGYVTMQAAEAAWHGAPATLAAYQESMRPLLEAGEPWRLIGEPVWLSYPGGERWSRYEAVANVAFAHYPYYSLCLHDTRRVAHPRVEQQLRTHPLVWSGEPIPNDHYVSPAAYLHSVEPPWTPAPSSAETVVVARPRTALAQVQELVEAAMLPSRQPDVLLGVYEVVSNALKVGVAAEVTHWRDGRAVVWQVRDDGPGLHDPLAGYAPPGRTSTPDAACGSPAASPTTCRSGRPGRAPPSGCTSTTCSSRRRPERYFSRAASRRSRSWSASLATASWPFWDARCLAWISAARLTLRRSPKGKP